MKNQIDKVEGVLSRGPHKGMRVTFTLYENYESLGFKSNFKPVRKIYLHTQHLEDSTLDRIYTSTGAGVFDRLRDFDMLKSLLEVGR